MRAKILMDFDSGDCIFLLLQGSRIRAVGAYLGANDGN